MLCIIIRTHGSRMAKKHSPCDDYQESFTHNNSVKKWKTKLKQTFLQVQIASLSLLLILQYTVTSKKFMFRNRNYVVVPWENVKAA